MKISKLWFLTMALAAALASTAQAGGMDDAVDMHEPAADTDTSPMPVHPIRAIHGRTVETMEAWLAERRGRQTPGTRHSRSNGTWAPYRSPYAHKARTVYFDPGFYALGTPYPHEFSCRFTADCPCRYLAGC